jgi:hypothetical protein
MKHVYPPRHPASLDAPTGQALPHERDESSSGQAATAPQHRETGHKACRDATGGGADTDQAPLKVPAGNEKAASDRGPDAPRR